MTKDEALDLALEALEESIDLVRQDYESAKELYGKYPSRQARLLGMEDGLKKHEEAITAIKQARSAPVQEPVAKYIGECSEGSLVQLYEDVKKGTNFYTTPPAQRQWVGLTDEEKRQIFEREDYQGWLDYINAIEAKLKEKNT